MMPEEAIPSVQSDSAPVITSGMGDQARADLNQEFDSFWEEQDAAAAATPPSAPPSIELKPAETRKPVPQERDAVVEEPEPEPKVRQSKSPSTKAPDFPDVEIPPAKAETQKSPDADIESIEALELHPGASEDQHGQWKQLKRIAKEKSQKLKLAEEKERERFRKIGYDQELPADPAERDKIFESRLQALRTTDPENEARLAISRASGLERSISYVKMYVEPVQRNFSQWIDEFSRHAGARVDPAQIKQWSETAKKVGPEKANSAWFTEQLNTISQYTDPAVVRRMQTWADNMMGMQEQGNREKEEILQNPPSYEAWHQANQQLRSQNTYNQVMACAQQALETTHQHMKPKGPDDPVYAARHQKAADIISPFVQEQEGVMVNPAAAAKFALDHIHMSERIPELEKENKEFAEQRELDKKEIAKLEKQLGIYRRTSGRELRPSAGNGSIKTTPEKPRIGAKIDFSGLGS